MNASLSKDKRVLNMKKQITKILTIAMSCILLTSIYAENPEELRVMAVSPDRGSAVVKYKNDDLKLVSIGEEIPESDLTVVQVLNDRIVTEYKDSEKNAHTDIDQIWLFKVKAGERKSEVKYLRHHQEQDEQDQTMQEIESISLETKSTEE